MSLRLNETEHKHILKWAKHGKKDKSQAARELLEYGWKFALLEYYRHGKASLGVLSKELNMPISEVMDFLAEHGAWEHLNHDDYLQSLDALRDVL